MKTRAYVFVLFLLSILVSISVGIATWVAGNGGIKSVTSNIAHPNKSEPVCYIAGETKKYFNSIESALSKANSGDIVITIPPKDKNPLNKSWVNRGKTYYLTGNGTPSSSLGSNGNTYLDLNSTKVYKKAEGKRTESSTYQKNSSEEPDNALLANGSIFYSTSSQNIFTLGTDNALWKTTDKVNYEISSDCEIKPGVTLVLPNDPEKIENVRDSTTLSTYIKRLSDDKLVYTSDRYLGDLTSKSYVANSSSYSSYYLRTTLTIKMDVVLKNNGTLVISGYLSGGNRGARAGHTAYAYSRIVLESGAKISQENSNAVTHCYGFIDENSSSNGSEFNVLAGTLKIPFVILDYKGMSYCLGYYGSNSYNDTNRSSFFNQYTLENCSVTTKVCYGAKVNAINNLYLYYDNSTVESMSVNEIIKNEVTLVGTQSGFLQFNNSDFSYLIYKYNNKEKTQRVDIYGGSTLNNLSFTLKLLGQSANISTSYAYFPIPYQRSISLNASKDQNTATFSASNQRIKLLTGSNFEVNGNVNFNVKDLIIYSSFNEDSIFSAKDQSLGHSVYYPLKNPAVFIVRDNAVMSATGGIAGNIFTDNSAAISNTGALTSREPWNFVSGTSYLPYWFSVDNYLCINENIQFSPISFLEKEMLSAGINVYSKTATNKPGYKIYISNQGEETLLSEISNYQKCIFVQNIEKYKITFDKNIYSFYYDKIYYHGNEEINFSEHKNVVSVASSTAISADQFSINSINVTSNTGETEVMVNYTLKLNATISNSVAYGILNKKEDITWESKDETVATVDNEGVVTGISEGTVIIEAHCLDAVGSIVITVVGEEEVVLIDDITVVGSGAASFTTANPPANNGYYYSYGDNTTTNLVVNITPSGAERNSIVWTLISSREKRQSLTNYDDYTTDSSTKRGTFVINNKTSISMKTGSGTGTSSEPFDLICEVVDKKNNLFRKTLKFEHKNDVDPGICLLPETEIMLSNGTIKKAKDITKDDELITFNHVSGNYEANKIIFNVITEEKEYPIVKLYFDNGKTTEIASGHGFFNLSHNNYEIYYAGEFEKHIGEYFATTDYINGKFLTNKAKLIKVENSKRVTKKRSPLTEYNVNVVSDGILTIADDIEGMLDSFKYKEDMKIDMNSLEKDIIKFGIYSYEDVKNVVPKYIFDVFNFAYRKIFIAKGTLSYDKVNYWIKRYVPDILEQNNIERDFEKRQYLGPWN